AAWPRVCPLFPAVSVSTTCEVSRPSRVVTSPAQVPAYPAGSGPGRGVPASRGGAEPRGTEPSAGTDVTLVGPVVVAAPERGPCPSESGLWPPEPWITRSATTSPITATLSAPAAATRISWFPDRPLAGRIAGTAPGKEPGVPAGNGIPGPAGVPGGSGVPGGTGVPAGIGVPAGLGVSAGIGVPGGSGAPGGAGHGYGAAAVVPPGDGQVPGPRAGPIVVPGSGPAEKPGPVGTSRSSRASACRLRLVTRSGGSQPAAISPAAPAGASAERTARGLGRAAAFLCRQAPTRSRSSTGTAARSGSWLSTPCSTVATAGPSKGPAPVAAKTSTEPSANTSLAGLTSVPSTCSGAM